MNIFIFYIKLILDAYRDTKRIVWHFKLLLHNGLIIIPKLFFIRLFFSFSGIRNLIKIKIRSNYNLSDYFLSSAEVSSKDVAYDIDKKGHSEIFFFKKDLTEKITKEIFLNEEFEYKKDPGINQNQLIKLEEEDMSSYFSRLKSNNISRVTGFIDLNKESVIKDLLTSKSFLSLASNYLNTNQVSISAAFFISNPVEISDSEKYANAQYFHWDNDFTKFLKFYIYLSDVDIESGPHIFIPYTHKKKLFQHSLCRLYSDKNILNSYNENIKFVGRKGAAFFEDSYGLHKGETPTKNSRLLLNVHYGRNKILYSNKDIFINI
jgi:hypothetical protein